MSLASPQNVAFSNDLVIDKIVRVYTGTYDPSTDCISRTYDYFGTPAYMWLYRIPHGLTRPVFCELLHSINGGTTFYEGGLNSKLAFSDSTYVYILHSVIYGSSATPSSQTVTYKVYCSWIDDYDNTNPLVETETYNSEPVLFDSRKNYQKILSQDEIEFTAGTFGTRETITVNHNLGYTPNVKVYFEAFDNEVWPLNAGGNTNPFLADGSQNECELFIKENTVEVTAVKNSNTAIRAWPRIYYDAT